MRNTEVQFINLTPHRIVLRSDGPDQILEPSGDIARVESKELSLGATANGIPVVERKFGDVENLPEPRQFEWTLTTRPGKLVATTIYIVSALVLAAVPYRSDVAAPDTGDTAIRNEAGHIVAVTRLIMNNCAIAEDDDCAF